MQRRKPSVSWLAIAVCLFLLASSVGAGSGDFSWRGLEDDAVTLLSRYIQIDTTNPPGNEIKAAQFLKAIFDREGIEARIIESAPGRGNLFARLRGDGSRKAIAACSITWTWCRRTPSYGRSRRSAARSKTASFGAAVRSTTKAAASWQLMTLLALKRQNTQLKGDVIFLGTADEEAGGVFGAGFLLDKHPELFKDVSVVFNEGGGIRVGDDGRARLYSVGVAEKVPLWLKLTAPGTPGHAASPGDNQAVLKLVAALNRLASYQSPIKVIPEVQKFYADSAATAPATRREQYLDLRKALQDPIVRRRVSQRPQQQCPGAQYDFHHRHQRLRQDQRDPRRSVGRSRRALAARRRAAGFYQRTAPRARRRFDQD